MFTIIMIINNDIFKILLGKSSKSNKAYLCFEKSGKNNQVICRRSAKTYDESTIFWEENVKLNKNYMTLWITCICMNESAHSQLLKQQSNNFITTAIIAYICNMPPTPSTKDMYYVAMQQCHVGPNHLFKIIAAF